eukprot:486709-Amphidinium_carterae.1
MVGFGVSPLMTNDSFLQTLILPSCGLFLCYASRDLMRAGWRCYVVREAREARASNLNHKYGCKQQLGC